MEILQNEQDQKVDEIEVAGKQLCEIVMQRTNELMYEIAEKYHKELQFFLDDVKYLYVTDDGCVDEKLKNLIQHIVAIGVTLEIIVQQRDEYFKQLNAYLAPLLEVSEDQKN